MQVHFIGIGGIGASALAQYYLNKGHQVSGSDLAKTEITDLLEQKGAQIAIGSHQAENLPKILDLIIYSPAVKKDNREMKAGCDRGVKRLSYPQALGELTKQYFTIAVSGTHGKSTTTAMLALILIKAGLDPTVIVGAKLKEFNNTNFRPGESKYLLIEADEWQASFLNYWPQMIILTNIEEEHLDYYRDLKHILQTYREYAGHLPEKGVLVANGEDKNIKSIILGGRSSREGATSRKASFHLLKQKDEVKYLKQILKVPGQHNIANALAALAAARALGLADKISFQALAEFKGAWRRFDEREFEIKNLKLKIINDYAHHPTEIKATLKAAKEKYSQKKIICVFQPHQYQRTFYLFDDFVKVFKQALREKWLNQLILTDIYDVAGRENQKIKQEVSAEKLVEKLKEKKAVYLPKEKIIGWLKNHLRDEEVVIIMGAGDINKLTQNSRKFSLGFSTGSPLTKGK